jgi:NitT/TauT family transport system permease protein
METKEDTKKITWSILPWILPLALIFMWFFVSSTRIVPVYLLPDPIKVLKTAYIYIFAEPGASPYAGRFIQDTTASTIRVFLGFSIATLLGLPLGILSGRVSEINRFFNTFINGLRAVPGITWLPLAMIWFGIGVRTTVFLVAMAAFFPIYLNAAAGARQINPLLLRAGAMMGVGKVRGSYAVLLPGAMPNIITGLRLGLGISWAYLVLGELTGVPNGLGAVIMDARMIGQLDMIIVGMILIAIVGKLSDTILITVLKISFKSARRMP